MVAPEFAKGRFLFLAEFRSVGTSWMEPATRRGIDGAGDVSRQNNPLGLSFRVGDRDSREEGDGVGVEGLVEEAVGRRVFEYLSQIHDSDVMANLPNGAEVV